MSELDGSTQDNKSRTLEISLEVETNYPMWEPRTIVSAEDCVTKISFASTFDNKTENAYNDGYYPQGGLNNPLDPSNYTNPESPYYKKKGLGRLMIHGTDKITSNDGEIV